MSPASPPTRLSAEEKHKLSLVRRAAFANPFGEERDRLDYEIAELGRKVSNEQLMATVKDAVTSLLGRLARAGRVTLASYAGEDRELVKTAAMFNLFHRYESSFDRFIQEQIAAAAGPLPCAFAVELLAELAAHGFADDEADRVLALFFQLRRAYFFIGRSFAGKSASINALRKHLWNNCFTFQIPWYERFLYRRMEDFSTLLLGETGTGKGTVAAAIGRSNYIPFDRPRRKFHESFTQAFLSINLAQYPGTLLESELFGHRKGAFTGAIDHHEGVFQRCSAHGAIFIDEVGDVSQDVQVKLLNVLQERSFTPVGAREALRFSGRVIAATNKDVAELRRNGELRDDFYYRLCSDVIVVPPLRQRLAEEPEELELLLTHVVREMLGEEALAAVPEIRKKIETQLPKGYEWSGNVRELEQCVRRILVTGTYGGDTARFQPRQAPTTAGAATRTGAAFESAQSILSAHCRKVYAELGTFEDTARALGLDRRTVKKYLET